MGKLIELNKVEMLIAEYKYERISIQTLQKSIQSLPQIDIVGEIEKMIEENKEEAKRAKNSPLFEPIYGYAQVRGGVLHQLLQKFKS